MLDCALVNLLDNAWKYTGITVTPAIRVHRGEVGGLRGICVSDNGAGFDMAQSERLFRPFQRLHRQDEFPGIGIGLATVQRIVHRHGGEIAAPVFAEAMTQIVRIMGLRPSQEIKAFQPPKPVAPKPAPPKPACARWARRSPTAPTGPMARWCRGPSPAR